MVEGLVIPMVDGLVIPMVEGLVIESQCVVQVEEHVDAIAPQPAIQTEEPLIEPQPGVQIEESIIESTITQID